VLVGTNINNDNDAVWLLFTAHSPHTLEDEHFFHLQLLLFNPWHLF